MSEDDPEPPVLPSFTVGRQVVVWCDHCCHFHWHGDCGVLGGGAGHRVAHCDVYGSPYAWSGYTLDTPQRLPPPLIKAIRNYRPPVSVFRQGEKRRAADRARGVR